MNNFLDDDIEIFTNNSHPNGIEYLKKSDINLPLRIKKQDKGKIFYLRIRILSICSRVN